jgi:hypothetical protein
LGNTRGKKRQLLDGYRFEGFRPIIDEVRGVFGDAKARILPLKRRSKKRDAVNVEQCIKAGMIARQDLLGICHAEIRACTWRSSSGGWTVGSVKG